MRTVKNSSETLRRECLEDENYREVYRDYMEISKV